MALYATRSFWKGHFLQKSKYRDRYWRMRNKSWRTVPEIDKRTPHVKVKMGGPLCGQELSVTGRWHTQLEKCVYSEVERDNDTILVPCKHKRNFVKSGWRGEPMAGSLCGDENIQDWKWKFNNRNGKKTTAQSCSPLGAEGLSLSWLWPWIQDTLYA